MNHFFRFIYSFIVVPFLITLAHLAALFDAKIRRAVLTRYHVIKKITEWKNNNDSGKDVLMIHACSMGEFEHIKPLIKRLSLKYDISIIVTFFSPSAYDSIKEFEGVDLFLYLPFDTKKNWRYIYYLVHPSLVVISKHDVWPNQVWVASDKYIPVYLVNASLSRRSRRVKFFARLLLSHVYRGLSEIYAISAEDKKWFETFYPGSRIKEMGDTKFDQVLIRKEETQKKSCINENWTKQSTVLVLGSIWPEDAQPLLSVLNEKMIDEKSLKLIIVPHQPSDKFIGQIREKFPHQETRLFSEVDKLKNERILIVDIIGVLADLYRYGDIAYVGGSFKQGIHNVMEPAVYHIPVIYGPVYRNSFEAIKLMESGGSRVIHSADEFSEVLNLFIKDKPYRRKISEQAGKYALKNLGATDRVLNEWNSILS